MGDTTTRGHDRSVSLTRVLAAAMKEGLEANFRRWFAFAGYQPGEWIELQALEVPSGKWTNTKFAHVNTVDDAIRLVTEAEAWNAPGIYILINRVNAAVATREPPGRWHVAKKNQSTTDAEIVARRFLYIDFDAKRPKGTSSTREELRAALGVMEQVYERLACLLGSTASLAAGMSGNGGAILVALDDLAPSDEVSALVKGILAAFAELHGTPTVKIDTSVSDLKRLAPAWGTTKRKGAPGITERPHRRAALITPDKVDRIGIAALQRLLERLVAGLTREQRAKVDRAMGVKSVTGKSASKTAGAADVFSRANECDVLEVLTHLGLYDGDDVTCPGCGTSGGSSVAVVGNGVKCLHNTCSQRGKSGFRSVVDLVMERRSISNIEAVRLLGEWFGFEVPAPKKEGDRTQGQAPTTATPSPPPEEWPAPQSLATSLAPVAPFDTAIMPAPFQPWAVDVTHRLQAPGDFAAVAAIVSMGAVIGRAVGIRPKAHDDWTVIPNLWGGAIADPGMYKSPSLKAALTFVNRLAAEAINDHEKAVEEANKGAVVNDALIKKLKKELDQAVSGAGGPRRGRGRMRAVGDDEEPASYQPPRSPEDIAAELAGLQKGEKPQLRRYVVNEPTVEKLGELLNQNDRGLLLFRDELVGFLYKLESDGHEPDRAFYLEAWDGNGQPFTYDRIQRGTIRIEAPCVSILGGVQPGPLMSYVRSTWKSGAGQDGLVQRFQLLTWPDTPSTCQLVDEWPDTEAKNRAYAIFKRASEPGLAVAIGAVSDPDDQDHIPYVRFARDAQPLFDDWYQTLMLRVRAEDEHPAVRSHLAKYASLMPSLALIFHVIAVLDGTENAGHVGPVAAALAIKWTAYLETHARRIYGAITGQREIAGGLLAAKIVAGKLADGFTARDVYLNGWAGLSDPEDVRLAIEELVEAKWLRPKAVPQKSSGAGGRPTQRFEINPKLAGPQ